MVEQERTRTSAAIQQTSHNCFVCRLQGCTCHKPEGCVREGRETILCPVCIINPCLQILRKIANHLELLKGEGFRSCLLMAHYKKHWSGCASFGWSVSGGSLVHCIQ